jgi:hypothetical protein
MGICYLVWSKRSSSAGQSPETLLMEPFQPLQRKDSKIAEDDVGTDQG